MFRETFGEMQVNWSWPETWTFDRSELIGTKNIEGGHYLYQEVCYLPRQFMTILRDPVERYLSHYWYVRGRAEFGQLHAAALMLDPLEFIERFPFFQNHMTKVIAGKSGVNFAIEALERFAWVGVLECWEHSIQRLEAVLGSSMPRIERMNVNRDRPPAPTWQIAQLRDLHQNDTILYEHFRGRS